MIQNHFKRILSLFLILSIFGVCKEEEFADSEPLDLISDLPVIESLNVHPSEVTALEDSLVFTIQYTDGNGDIGFENPDSISLWLTDLRIPLKIGYHIAPVTPDGADIAVRGEINISLSNIDLVDSTLIEEQAIFTVQLKDRAGNFSNEISSNSIRIIR